MRQHAEASFWWIKLRALAAAGDWTGLETFAKSKKSPIGYEPFVVSILPSHRSQADGENHLLSLSPPQLIHAASFVPRCDPKLRADLYVQCGDWGKAAESAKERGDKAKLE